MAGYISAAVMYSTQLCDKRKEEGDGCTVEQVKQFCESLRTTIVRGDKRADAAVTFLLWLTFAVMRVYVVVVGVVLRSDILL